MTPEHSDVMTFEDACDYLRLKRSYLYMLTSTEQIPFYKIGNHLRFRRSRLDQWLASQEYGAHDLPDLPIPFVAEEVIEYVDS